MGRRHRAKRRDDNEQAIVDALEAAGASVSRIDGDDGEPDLLVGYDCRTELMEVKREERDRRQHGGGGASRPGRGGDGVLTAPQLGWRARWKGKPAALVATPVEALAVIGVVYADLVLVPGGGGLPLPAPRSPRGGRRPKVITSDQARAIRADAMSTVLCDRMGHPRVVSTQHCACGYQLYPDVVVAPPPAPAPRKRAKATIVDH